MVVFVLSSKGTVLMSRSAGLCDVQEFLEQGGFCLCESARKKIIAMFLKFAHDIEGCYKGIEGREILFSVDQ